jgi:hypothetical protein
MSEETVKKSVAGAIVKYVSTAAAAALITLKVVGPNGETVSTSELENAIANGFNGARCFSVTESILSPEVFDSVTVAVRDSLGDSVGTVKQWAKVRDRIVQGIELAGKNNPSYVTQTGDKAYKLFWIEHVDSTGKDTTIALTCAVFYPVAGRLLVDYTTSAEGN